MTQHDDKAQAQPHETAVTRRDFAGLAGMGAILALCRRPVPASAQDSEEAPDATVTSSASSTVPVAPDRAEVSLSIEAAGSDLVQIQEDLATGAERVCAALEGAGIPRDSVAVSDMQVSPQYDGPDSSASAASTAPTITGYAASVSVEVSDIEVGALGAAISAGIGAGANAVSGIQYTCSTYDDVYEQALSQACERASRKATVMAQALGRELGQIVSVSEGYEDQSARALSASADLTGAAASAYAQDASAKIAFDPGTIDVRASVDITYALE